jgi:hypothetical protein
VVAAAKTPASLELDLTDVVEVIDDDPMDVAPRAAVPLPHAPVDSATETVDVYELSVEPDLAPVVEEPTAAESAAVAPADANGDRRKKNKRATKSAKTPQARQGKAPAAQNEWGVFDPNQCGFAALVDKLDEVADEKTKQPQTGTKARVISLS